MRPKSPVFFVLAAPAWLVALGLIANIAAHGGKYQWDFKVYYHAAQAFHQGLNPYDVGSLRQMSGNPSDYLPFLYPPLTLFLFLPFTALSLPTAGLAWFLLKIAALVGLFALWNRRLLPLTAGAGMVAFFLLAFNKTLYTDLCSGNISVFEELALWLGFAFLLAGRETWFCVCVVLAAQFKVTPVLFLLLLPVVGKRPPGKLLLGALAAFGLLFSLNATVFPALTRSFWQSSRGIDHRGSNDPSTLAFFRDFRDILAAHSWPLPHAAATVLYLLAAMTVLFVSRPAFRRSPAVTLEPRVVIFFACVVYALVMPRFTNYTYILLLIPALYALQQEPRAWLRMLAGIVVLISPLLGAAHMITTRAPLLFDYLPLWGAYLIWGLYLRDLLRPALTPPAEREISVGTLNTA